MEYQVPQFIDVEDKIFGPLTISQFVYLAGGVGLAIGLVLYLPFIIGVLFAIPVAALAGALAFYKMNGKPFIAIMESGIAYYLGRRLYLWKKEEKAPEVVAPVVREVVSPKLGLTKSKLSELAQALDTQKHI